MIPLTLFTGDYRVPGTIISVNPEQISALIPGKFRAILTEGDISIPQSERPLILATEVFMVNVAPKRVEESLQEILDLISGLNP